MDILAVLIAKYTDYMVDEWMDVALYVRPFQFTTHTKPLNDSILVLGHSSAYCEYLISDNTKY